MATFLQPMLELGEGWEVRALPWLTASASITKETLFCCEIFSSRDKINAAFSDDDEIGLGAGLATSDFGLRLRYEIVRQFAPYIGLAWSNAFGKTKDLRRTGNEKSNQLSIVGGVRFWF